MILSALKDLAEREDLITNPDFEVKPISYLIIIDQFGQCLEIREALTEDLMDKVKSKDKSKPKAKNFLVPRPFPGARRSGKIIDPGFLVDNVSFVFGSNVGSVHLTCRQMNVSFR